MMMIMTVITMTKTIMIPIIQLMIPITMIIMIVMIKHHNTLYVIIIPYIKLGTFFLHTCASETVYSLLLVGGLTTFPVDIFNM
jgi:Tfp pilus assembly protein PilZ